MNLIYYSTFRYSYYSTSLLIYNSVLFYQLQFILSVIIFRGMRGRKLLESKDIASKTFFMKNILISLFLASIQLKKEVFASIT